MKNSPADSRNTSLTLKQMKVVLMLKEGDFIEDNGEVDMGAIGRVTSVSEQRIMAFWFTGNWKNKKASITSIKEHRIRKLSQKEALAHLI